MTSSDALTRLASRRSGDDGDVVCGPDVDSTLSNVEATVQCHCRQAPTDSALCKSSSLTCTLVLYGFPLLSQASAESSCQRRSAQLRVVPEKRLGRNSNSSNMRQIQQLTLPYSKMRVRVDTASGRTDVRMPSRIYIREQPMVTSIPGFPTSQDNSSSSEGANHDRSSRGTPQSASDSNAGDIQSASVVERHEIEHAFDVGPVCTAPTSAVCGQRAVLRVIAGGKPARRVSLFWNLTNWTSFRYALLAEIQKIADRSSPVLLRLPFFPGWCNGASTRRSRDAGPSTFCVQHARLLHAARQMLQKQMSSKSQARTIYRAHLPMDEPVICKLAHGEPTIARLAHETAIMIQNALAQLQGMHTSRAVTGCSSAGVPPASPSRAAESRSRVTSKSWAFVQYEIGTRRRQHHGTAEQSEAFIRQERSEYMMGIVRRGIAGERIGRETASH
ncbi:hypothetical protein BV25DRAFT_1842467 [Artomyces pyxidatus]|uniref:Uncharacterized protein n=1 Tax=Artomyces pyxidatus TaxID=48021 RepID=A0ACB8SIH7_9AGAM|nr:hypothetical protein BV25DRAFT_1842467 [Artomyces pyxidatus]